MTMLSAVARAIDAFARPATRIRFAASGWQANGTFDEAAGTTELPIVAVVQAPTAADLRALKEGERVEGKVAIWTRTDLIAGDPVTGRQGDHVRAEDGRTYRVTQILKRSEGGFVRAMGEAIDERSRGL